MCAVGGRTDPGAIVAVAARALGGRGRAVGVERLRGGTRKGVYRVRVEGGRDVVVYVWGRAEHRWPEAAVEREGPFADPDGLDLFLGAARVLEGAGVRVPAVEWVERDHPGPGVDMAVVEDVPGPDLEGLLARDRRAGMRVVERLGSVLETMASLRGSGWGRVSGAVRGEGACERLVLERALRDLAEGARRRPDLAAVRGRVERGVVEAAARVEPRRRYGLVHGELGPDHVLVGAGGEPVLIDVEGTMFFDVEWEHVFVRLRFGDLYRSLEVPGLDGARLGLYAWAQRLSLVAGPLRLLEGGFADRRVLEGIVEAQMGWIGAHV
ncbi:MULTISPECIES: phosphotransferase family protein [Nocardiopsis]|uniref:phosphotransferase family protein n=1 Tax=Nocardiopsis TaxID=2013 RepID=UPI002DB9ED21|nr:phosphotransferase [Nocardiopsis sp. LDBS1602]MEC3891251.1 phosphotransferase [Nocardiopsis sp. LDBS1602]